MYNNLHQKGKSTNPNMNSSYQSTTLPHNNPTNFQSSFENPYNSLYMQNSRRGSYDNSMGGTNFSGFFSPANPGNFYSFEQPIVFNSISNINLPQKQKKNLKNDSFRQQYLDTIKEVYKPRHNKTQDFNEKMIEKGYLHGGALDKMREIHLPEKKFPKDFNFKYEEETNSVQESGNESTEEIKKFQGGDQKKFSVKKKFKEENHKKHYMLPEIERKNITGSLDKNKYIGKTLSFQEKNSLIEKQKKNISVFEKSKDKLESFRNMKNGNEGKETERAKHKTISKELDQIRRKSINDLNIQKIVKQEEPLREYGIVMKKNVENNYENSDENSKSNQTEKKIFIDSKFVTTSNQTEIKITADQIKNIQNSLETSPNFRKILPVKIEEPSNNFTNDSPNNNNMNNLINKINNDNNINELNNEKNFKNIDNNINNLNNKIDNDNNELNNDKIVENTLIEKEIIPNEPLDLNLEPSTALNHDNAIKSQSEPMHKTLSIKVDNPPENAILQKMTIPLTTDSLNNFHSQNSITPLNLLEIIKTPKSEVEHNDENIDTPLSIPLNLEKSRPPDIKTKRHSKFESATVNFDKSPSVYHLSPSKLNSSLRRGTNTSGLDNSFSFMKKILDDPDNDTEDYHLKHAQTLRKIVLQHCDSLTNHSTPTNAIMKDDFRLLFNQKNANYQKKKKFEEREKNPKKQKLRTSMSKIATRFKKQTMKFLKLLTNLLNSFRNFSEETNSFIFVESRVQNDEKPLLNLKEILRKKTLEDQQILIKPKKFVLQRSGTFLSEKYNSAFSFTSSPSPNTEESHKEMNNTKNPVFLINVHPPIKDEIVMEHSEMEESQNPFRRKKTDELENLMKKAENMRLNVEEEQEKMMKIQVFQHKKLWKLSVGLLITNFKLLLINEKDFMFRSIHPPFSLNEFPPPVLQIQKTLGRKDKSLSLYKISTEIKIVLREYEFSSASEDDLLKNTEVDEGRRNTLKDLEDESYEEVFEEDGGFIEDVKKFENYPHLKFSYESRFDGELEPFGVRKKANDFLRCLPETVIPISTSLDHSFLANNYRPPFDYNEELDSNILRFQNINKAEFKINKLSQENPTALIEFYRMHYEDFFTINGDFEDEIVIPVFEVMSSPTLNKKQESPKHLTLHIPLGNSKDLLPQCSPITCKSASNLERKETQFFPSKPNIKIITENVKESSLYKTKSDRNLLGKAIDKERSPSSVYEEDEEKENDKSQNFIQLPIRNNIRTQTTLSENLVPPTHMDLNIPNRNNIKSQITSYENLVPASPVDSKMTLTPMNNEKFEKKLSFSIMDTSKMLMRKDGKNSGELSALKFINNIRKNKDKHLNPNSKFQKSSKQLLTSENDMKSLENNNKMDKSSLFFRNQLITINKMKGMETVEQFFWAIKYNNIHKIEELLLIYPSIMIDSRDEDNNSFLNVAAQIGNFEIVNLFLLKGANVNIQNNDGNTALHLALSYNNDAIADKLISFGAQENIKNNEGKTAWDMYLKK